jgi:hypothetical protein
VRSAPFEQITVGLSGSPDSHLVDIWFGAHAGIRPSNDTVTIDFDTDVARTID